MDTGEVSVVNGRKELSIMLLLSVIASVFFIVSFSTALEDRLTNSQHAIDRASAMISQSNEKAESLADRISAIKQEAAFRNSQHSTTPLYKPENTKQDAFNKSYPTGLIVTPEELAENKANIAEATSLLSASDINISYP